VMVAQSLPVKISGDGMDIPSITSFLACCYNSDENAFFQDGRDRDEATQLRVRRKSSIGTIDLCDTEFERPFLEAVATRNLEEMKRIVLIDSSIVRTVRDTRGKTAAHIAACYGHRKERSAWRGHPWQVNGETARLRLTWVTIMSDMPRLPSLPDRSHPPRPAAAARTAAHALIMLQSEHALQ
jgi:hypothetical protein